MKTILLVGSGVREHAIAKALHRSTHPHQLICIASHDNPGIKGLVKKISVMSLTDIEAIKAAILKDKIDFAIIGPEAPLEAGLVDALKEIGIPSIGPERQLAQIETSKSFSRNLLQKYEPSALPTFKTFKSMTGLMDFAASLNHEFVIKGSGLMGGKGVFVSGEHFEGEDEAKAICEKLLSKKRGVLIEEKLVGEEFSLLSFCDGKTLIHMPIVQDNKRAYFDDKGPNTGGMGSVSYADHSLPFLFQEEVERAQFINQRAIEGLQEECGGTYKGILYGGYMITRDGVKLIEFNARFGDPECVNLLELLETDLIDICEAMITGSLDTLDVLFQEKASVCKYVVPHGYPHLPVKNERVQFDIEDESIFCGHIGTKDNTTIMLGSRAVAVIGVGETVASAEEKAEAMARSVKGNVFYRNDIGKESLLSKRIERMKGIREQAS